VTTKVGIDDFIAENGADRATVEALPALDYWPVLAPEAYYGLAGRIVQTIEPYSEADPVALLLHVLVGAGNVIGRGLHARVEETPHPCNEFVALVGRTAKGRKGQAWSTPRRLFAAVDEQWARTRIRSGLSSGEGLIYNVRDARSEQQPVKERGGRVVDYQTVMVDEGEADKRLLVFEPELATVLRRMQGEGNTLSAVIREAWDSGRLGTLTKNSPLRATDAHVSIIAHITQEELIASLTETDRANGFANRFLFVLVRRSKVLPEGAAAPPAVLAPLVAELQEVVTWATASRELRRDPEGRERWAAVYPTLSEGEPGLLGAVLGRAESHALRLSLIFAALDCSPVVRPDHLAAALAVWDYAETSARRIFGDALGLSVADTILAALRARGPLTRDDLRQLFHRNRSSAEIETAVRLLLESGKVQRSLRPSAGGKGRPAQIWEAVTR
jgi:hypothetical protein